jgi:hypothetical protein
VRAFFFSESKPGASVRAFFFSESKPGASVRAFFFSESKPGASVRAFFFAESMPGASVSLRLCVLRCRVSLCACCVWAGGVSMEEAGQAATAQLTRLVDRAQVGKVATKKIVSSF